jgi:signal transduction histidine kinase
VPSTPGAEPLTRSEPIPILPTVSGEDGVLGEIRRALAGITRRLDALADAVGVAAAAEPGALLDEPSRAHLASLQSFLAIGTAATTGEACVLAVDRTITHARADCAALFRLAPAGTLESLAQRGFPLRLALRDADGIVGRSLRTGEIVQAAPGLGGPDALLDVHGLGCALVVPVLDRAGAPAAVLLAGRRRVVPFEPDAVGAMIIVADRVAGALGADRPTAGEAGTPSAVFASLDLTRTARAVAAEAGTRLEAEAIAVLLPDGEALLFAGGVGVPDDAAAPPRVPALTGTASSRRPWSPTAGEPVDRELSAWLGAPPRAVLPLTVADQLVALLAIGARSPCRTTLSPAFATDAARALRNARLHAEALRTLADAPPAPPPPTSAGDPPLGDMASLLAVVLGRLAAAREGVTEATVARALADAEEAAWRVAEAVRRVLGFTPGSDPHAAVPVDLGALVREAVRATEAAWAGADPAPPLTLDLEPVPPIRGHPDELRQAVQHLLRNAREALDEPVPIVVRLRWDGGAQIELAVGDRGRGMDDATRRRAGEPFFTTKGPGRLGVGLAVAEAVAARHRGEVTIESVLGHGTTVRLRLPTAGGARSRAARPAPVSRKVVRILVVEDEKPIRETVVQGLTRDGYAVSAAQDVGEALTLFGREAVDVVVTDLVLPGGSGLEIARAVKRTRPGTAVILVTGWPGRVDPETLKSHGVDTMLEKPVGLDALRATVATLVERLPAGPG